MLTIGTAPCNVRTSGERSRPIERYTRIAVALHWIVALLFLVAYAAVYYRQWFTVRSTPENITAIQIHYACGISIGVFVLLRLVWRLFNRPPAPPPVPAWQRRAARVSQALLYFFMILMPLTGYGGSRTASKYLSFVPAFPETALYKWLVTDTLGIAWNVWDTKLDALHQYAGAYFVWPLIAIHTAVALYHHYHRRDRLMRRMWF
jgi:cytochrome b561